MTDLTNDTDEVSIGGSALNDGLESLLPCPFCGSSAIGIRYEGQPALRYAFSCSDCRASTGAVYVGGTVSGTVILFNNPDAVKRWNMRSNV